MPIRDYNFVTGAETGTLPTAGTPSAAADLITKSYADANYAGVAPAITGTRGSPSAVVAGTGIVFAGTGQFNLWFIQGSGGAVDISVNPQIVAGTVIGQQLNLIGRSDTNTVTFEDGTGLSLNGTAILGEDQVLTLIWDSSAWVELGRSF